MLHGALYGVCFVKFASNALMRSAISFSYPILSGHNAANGANFVGVLFNSTSLVLSRMASWFVTGVSRL
jgi:hypothetical protein